MVDVDLPAYFSEQALDLLAEAHLPQAIYDKIAPIFEQDAPAAFNAALDWVVAKQQETVPARLDEEMQGIAAGVCSVKSCDADTFVDDVRRFNALPELVRMQCSMVGAWGEATPDAAMAQLRTLDFGEGPFGNLTTSRPASSAGSRTGGTVSRAQAARASP